MADKSKIKLVLKHLGLMLLVSVIIILIFSFTLGLCTRHGQNYDAPDLTGYTLEELKMLQKKYDFDYIITDSLFVKNKQPGTVYKQNPAAGEKIKKGRNFYIQIVRMKPKNVVFPKFIDVSLQEMETILKSRDLEIGRKNYVSDISSNKVRAAYFNGSALKAGDTIPQGSVIDLDISVMH
ncbi:MAG: PASTA domain-containing protein [Bacteroidales bacterium]|jgi:beta-lactam-binding protein with PASTA domain|nr:PASTA domain-containing protein [Bacteroidales bacterium]